MFFGVFINSSLLLLLLSRFLLLLSALLISICNGQQSTRIEIETDLGTISGVKLRTNLDNRAIGFLGIPYALPPVDKLRFKKPIPYPKWYPKTLSAQNYKQCCPQLDINGLPHGQEDCLYLNVFVPLSNLPSHKPIGRRFPVMIYIQGESFENGDAALYGPEYLLDYDVILITFNYRLGILGFLSTGDRSAIGNWGLYDQLLVLQWVQDHIQSFGGDPSQVTLFGQGAGASSAIIHMISPLSSGLFQRVIAQSGSPLCPWSIEFNGPNISKELARKLNCPIRRGTEELVDCLRKVKLNLLLEEQKHGKIFGEYPHQFVPVIEEIGFAHERLIPNEPRKLISQGHYRRIPLMMGYNRDETAFLYPLILNKRMIGNNTNNLRYYLEEKLLPKFIRATILPNNNRYDNNATYELINQGANRLKVASTISKMQNYEQEIKQNILFRYFNYLNSKNYPEMAYRFVNMSTDALYGSCIDETLRLYSAASTATKLNKQNNDNNPISLSFVNITYKYLFNYRGHNSMLNLILQNNNEKRLLWWPHSSIINSNYYDPTMNAICHGDELFYLFNLKFSTRNTLDNRDQLMQRKLLHLWTDFAKHGFPPFIPDSGQSFWPPFSTQKPYTYLLQERSSSIDSYHESATQFWLRYLPSLSSSLINSKSIVNRSKWHPTYNNNNKQPNGRSFQPSDNLRSMTTLRTFAWSMLALSLILFVFIVVLMLLLFYQRRRQSADLPSNVYNVGELNSSRRHQPHHHHQTSTKTLAAHVLNAQHRRTSLSSQLY